MGSDPATSQSFRYIEATAHRSKKLTVQQLQKSWAWYRMMNAGRMVKVYDRYEQPLYVTPPTTGRWIDRDDLLPDAVSTEPAAMANWTNKFLTVPLSFNTLELWQKEGDPTQLWNLADLRGMEAAWARGRMMASAIFNGASGKQPEGLSYAITKAAPSAQTAVIGGLSQATYSWWRTKYAQLSSNFGTIAAGSTIPAGLLSAQILKDYCTIGTQVPTDLWTLQAVFRMFKRAMLEVSNPHYLVGEKVAVANYAFENIKFDGLSLGWDPNCPSDSIYAVHLGKNFDPSQTGDPRDTAKLDRDLEEAPNADSFIETEGGIWACSHPNIRSRKLGARSPYRQLAQTEWLVDTFNLIYGRPSDNGVAGSDNGSRWSTW